MTAEKENFSFSLKKGKEDISLNRDTACLQGAGFPGWVDTVFGSSAVVVAAVMSILLNLTLPKED